jgi:hypothetical protein
MPRTIADILGCASPTNTREPDDFYATPHECTEALIVAEGDQLPAQVWDPFCGAGDISIVLQRHGHEVVSTDLIDRGCGQGGVDCLLQRTALARAIVRSRSAVPRHFFGMRQSWESSTSRFCTRRTGLMLLSAAAWSKPSGARRGAISYSGGPTSRTKARRR